MPRHHGLSPSTSRVIRTSIRASAREALTSLGVDTQRLHARADRILRYTSKTHAVYCRNNGLRRTSHSDDIEMQASRESWDDVSYSDGESMDSTEDVRGPLITLVPPPPLPLNLGAPLSASGLPVPVPAPAPAPAAAPATVVSPLEIISPKPKRLIPDLAAYLEDEDEDEAEADADAEDDEFMPRTESPEPMAEFEAGWASFPQPQIHEAPPSSASNSSASTDVSSLARSFDWIPVPSSLREHTSSCPSFPEPRPFGRDSEEREGDDHLPRFWHPNPDPSDSSSSLPSAFIFGDPMHLVVAPTFPVPEPFLGVNGDVWSAVHMRCEHKPISSGPL